MLMGVLKVIADEVNDLTTYVIKIIDQEVGIFEEVVMSEDYHMTGHRSLGVKSLGHIKSMIFAGRVMAEFEDRNSWSDFEMKLV